MTAELGGSICSALSKARNCNFDVSATMTTVGANTRPHKMATAVMQTVSASRCLSSATNMRQNAAHNFFISDLWAGGRSPGGRLRATRPDPGLTPTKSRPTIFSANEHRTQTAAQHLLLYFLPFHICDSFCAVGSCC